MTTNARTLVDTSAASKEQFADLPSSKQAQDMILGKDVESGQTTGSSNPAVKAEADKKLAGKFTSKEELEKGYIELQATLGRQGQEIGQLRSLTTQLLGLQTTEKKAQSSASQEPVKLTSDELLRDPAAAIERVVQAVTKPLEETVTNNRAAQIEQAFVAAHPTYNADMQDPAFAEFVTKSRYRQGLAARAKNGDLAAADELFTAWEEARPTVKDDKPDASDKGKEKKEIKDRQQALNDAAMVTAGGGAGASVGKPIYSAAKLLEKRMKDPTGYYDEAFQQIITEAALEKRIR